MDRKTPLHDVHIAEGGTIVPFAGYLLPLHYATGAIAEHEAVRTAAGMLDISYRGTFLFTGPTALDSLNHLITNDLSAMPAGTIRHGMLCTADGGCIDDLMVCKFADDEWIVAASAANRLKSFAHMVENILAGTHLENISDSLAGISLQGPHAQGVLEKLCEAGGLPTACCTCVRHVDAAGIDCLVSRTGSTGEFGYELLCAADKGAALWQALREAGAELGLIPCGLGARDTLRLEASLPLYGHEMDETITPLEAGLGSAVRLDKDEFIGRDALIAAGDPRRIRVGLEGTGRDIIHGHQDVYLGDERIGRTTSGAFAPHLEKAIAMALVGTEHAAVGTEVEVDAGGRRVGAVIVPMPFYRRA